MKRTLLFLYALYACLFTSVAAIDLEDAKNDLRIQELLTNLLCPLAVEPAIPANFVALSPRGYCDPYDWIYWGPKDVLKRYFENPESLETPVLRVKLSANVAQTGPDTFNNENVMQSVKELKQLYPEGEFSFSETKWGDYPVRAVKAKVQGKSVFTAWVGLNDPEAGWTLMFNLVYPDKKGHPDNTDCQLWDRFLTYTEQLKEGDYFKALGQDLQEGYTIVNIGGIKLKMLAEKRQSDGALQVAVILPKDVEFSYYDMLECLMGAKWKYGQPMVKVQGEITVKNENVHSISNQVTSIFYKTVPEFTLHQEGKNLLLFQK